MASSQVAAGLLHVVRSPATYVFLSLSLSLVRVGKNVTASGEAGAICRCLRCALEWSVARGQ